MRFIESNPMGLAYLSDGLMRRLFVVAYLSLRMRRRQAQPAARHDSSGVRGCRIVVIVRTQKSPA